MCFVASAQVNTFFCGCVWCFLYNKYQTIQYITPVILLYRLPSSLSAPAAWCRCTYVRQCVCYRGRLLCYITQSEARAAGLALELQKSDHNTSITSCHRIPAQRHVGWTSGSMVCLFLAFRLGFTALMSLSESVSQWVSQSMSHHKTAIDLAFVASTSTTSTCLLTHMWEMHSCSSVSHFFVVNIIARNIHSTLGTIQPFWCSYWKYTNYICYDESIA